MERENKGSRKVLERLRREYLKLHAGLPLLARIMARSRVTAGLARGLDLRREEGWAIHESTRQAASVALGIPSEGQLEVLAPTAAAKRAMRSRARAEMKQSRRQAAGNSAAALAAMAGGAGAVPAAVPRPPMSVGGGSVIGGGPGFPGGGAFAAPQQMFVGRPGFGAGMFAGQQSMLQGMSDNNPYLMGTGGGPGSRNGGMPGPGSVGAPSVDEQNYVRIRGRVGGGGDPYDNASVGGDGSSVRFNLSLQQQQQY